MTLNNFMNYVPDNEIFWNWFFAIIELIILLLILTSGKKYRRIRKPTHHHRHGVRKWKRS